MITITLQKGTNKGDQIARMEDNEVSVSHARFMVNSHKFISKYTEVSSRHVDSKVRSELKVDVITIETMDAGEFSQRSREKGSEQMH